MTMAEIIEYLKTCGVSANEKTLRGDIKLIMDMGIDIVKVTSRPNRYFWGERQFEQAELKLLIDAVSASRFITKKKSERLCEKLGALASTHQKSELRRHLFAADRVRSENEKIYYMVDTINRAINLEHRICFNYLDFDQDLKPVNRHDGEVYELSPYAMIWNDDFYYVVGWSEKHDNVSTYRVDRMDSPYIIDEKAVPEPADFRLEDYSRRIFEMYDGEPVQVKLECKNDLAKYIVDRFGTQLETKKTGDDRFEVIVEVSLSPTFYAWVFRFGGEIRILSPGKAVNEITEMARKLAERETI